MSRLADTGTRPQDLYKGAIVRYGKDRRGMVVQVFPELDEFWLNDTATGEAVRDSDGAKASFRADELEIIAVKAPAEKSTASSSSTKGSVHAGASCVRVLLIGGHSQMLRILEHFGTPDKDNRRDPQVVLAIPCDRCRCGPKCLRFDASKVHMCEIACTAQRTGAEGMDDDLLELAQRLRPDIGVRIRPYHLKQAYEQIGPDLWKLDGHYCLSAVTLPYGEDDINASSQLDRYFKEQVRCQIDFNTSAEGFLEDGDTDLVKVAQRALRETCSIALSASMWTDQKQFSIRKSLGVPDIPLKVWDGSETKVLIVFIPEDATMTARGGLLSFGEAKTKPTAGPTASESAEEARTGVKRKTVADWRLEQEEFKDERPLPSGWIRVKSSSGQTYYWNTGTKQSTFEFPLPPGWTKQISKTTGKTYYFNAKKRKSSFEIPTEE
eukprot:TRINITY_DN12516_c2_g5_i1.p1 TRINITY_DN12516_c2_g5~~TRINITY_DN12516_c2_g5_i1.p1  ORF type:complete len:469 (+),score=60.70 TRINITY_DN12516_c2_g5_i1:98-1408(+)